MRLKITVHFMDGRPDESFVTDDPDRDVPDLIVNHSWATVIPLPDAPGVPAENLGPVEPGPDPGVPAESLDPVEPGPDPVVAS